MSTYVGKMKDILVSFNNAALDIRKKKQTAQEQYKDDIAASEIAKLQNQLKQAEATARGQIADILQQAVAAAKQWAMPDGTKIDAADLELLRGDFNLSVEDLNALLVKHQGNPQLSFLLATEEGKGLAEIMLRLPQSYVVRLDDLIRAIRRASQ